MSATALAIDRALSVRSPWLDLRRAQTIDLVYFGGFNRTEVAAALDVSEGTVDRDLRLARAWLKTALEA